MAKSSKKSTDDERFRNYLSLREAGKRQPGKGRTANGKIKISRTLEGKGGSEKNNGKKYETKDRSITIRIGREQWKKVVCKGRRVQLMVCTQSSQRSLRAECWPLVSREQGLRSARRLLSKKTIVKRSIAIYIYYLYFCRT